MGRQAKCYNCNQKIIWCITVNGKRLPINSWPAPSGNVVLLDPIDSPRAPRCAVLNASERSTSTETKYLAHFATCKARKKDRAK